MLFSLVFAFISVGYVLSLYSGYPFKKTVFLEFGFLFYIIILIIFNLVAFIPSLFTSNFSVQEFFIYYTRTPNLEPEFVNKWLLYCCVGGILTYFTGKAVRSYNFSLEIEKIKMKLKLKLKKKKKSIFYKDSLLMK